MSENDLKLASMVVGKINQNMVFGLKTNEEETEEKMQSQKRRK